MVAFMVVFSVRMTIWHVGHAHGSARDDEPLGLTELINAFFDFPRQNSEQASEPTEDEEKSLWK